ncbi:type VI secretion system tube protein Hcp [Ferruginibacter sp.]
MQKLLFLLLLLPVIGFAQRQDVYIKFTDATGKAIVGDVTIKGFEKSIAALTIGSAGRNNVQTNFTMPITGASADLKKAMTNNETLQSGMVSVTQVDPASGRQLLMYTIKMEGIKVNTCSESMGCNSTTTTATSITATRIGWTYYEYGKTGVQSVSRKFGFDASTGKEWTGF